MIELIEANAGAGKTTTIVKRYTELLEDFHPDNIVLITFTEAAAAELKDKVKSNLESTDNEKLKEKLVYLPTAPIGTIHSFCFELLKRFGSRYGSFQLDTSVANPLEVERFLDQAIVEILKDFQAKHFSKFSQLISRIDYDQPRAFKSLIGFLKEVVKNRTRYLFYKEEFAVEKMFAEIDRLFKELPEENAELENEKAYERSKKEKEIANFLLNLLKEVLKAYSSYLKSEKKIDYSGILLEAHELVLHNDNARKDIIDHFRVFIVDEFQDTDPIQWEILKTIEESDENIYMLLVGDPKQSIYRFRSADLFIWNEAKEKAKKVSESLNNYRSAPKLIELINSVFNTTYNKARLGFKEELTYSPSVPKGRGEGEVIVYPMRNSKKQKEAFAQFSIAESFDYAKNGTVGIIGRTRKDLEPFKSILKSHGIEFTYISSSPYATLGVEELLHLLKWLINPNDKKSLFFLLSSRFVGYTHSEALKVALHKEHPAELQPFFQICEEARNSLGKELHSILILNLLNKLNYLEALYLTDYTSYISVMEVINQIFLLESNEIVDFPEIVRYIEELKNTREQPGRGINKAEKGYVLTTIHGAKGLEFDSVIVVPWKFQSPRGNFLFTSLGFVAQLFSPEKKPEESPYFYKLKRVETVLNILEEKNLLYVAMTRARKQLIWGLFIGSKPEERGYWKTGKIYLPADTLKSLARTKTSKKPGKLSINRSFRELNIKEIKKIEPITPSSLEKEFLREKSPYLPEGISPKDYGIAVHALCEAFIKGASKNKAVEYALSHLLHSVKGLKQRLEEIFSTLTTKFPDLKGAKVEVPFLYMENGKVIKGRVDIVKETPKGIEIWDIKTGTFSHEKVKTYKKQLQIYRDAFTKAGYKVASTKLLFIDENRVIDV